MHMFGRWFVWRFWRFAYSKKFRCSVGDDRGTWKPILKGLYWCNYMYKKTLKHLHPIYENLYCGAKNGIFVTDERNVTCPDCLENMRKVNNGK